MSNKKNRTYSLRESTIEWIDEFSDENNVDKSDVVGRAVRVYAIKVKRGEWKDPKFEDAVDSKFGKIG